MLDTAARPDAARTSAPLDTRLGPVHIAVTDGDRALPVWRDLVGLTVLSRTTEEIRLGAAGRTLVVLHPGAARPVVQHTSGLYHVAIHVPQRIDLARAIARMIGARYRNSPTDHLVTETTYLWDPDGNGIEMTFETPWRGRFASEEQDFYAITTDGKRHSGREPVDLDSMLAELKPGDDLTTPLPAGTRVGHVHVHVGDLDRAMAFYAETLGFARQILSRRFGMGDVRTNYEPHILAFNIWAGPDAPQAPEGSAGLRWFTVEYPDAAALAEARDRLAADGAPIVEAGDAIETRDPSGNRLRLAIAG